MRSCITQQFLLEAGHDSVEISQNSDWNTPLMLASKHGRIEVGQMLIERFPRCVPWTNKEGVDAVSQVAFHSPGRLKLKIMRSSPWRARTRLPQRSYLFYSTTPNTLPQSIVETTTAILPYIMPPLQHHTKHFASSSLLVQTRWPRTSMIGHRSHTARL